MVDSLDELKSLRSVYGKAFPNSEMLDAKIASALNKIIQNSQFKKKVSFEEQKAQKVDRFRRGRQITFMIYDYFRVTGAHDTVLDYADLFSVTFHDDNVQEFDTRWDEVLLSMSKIPSDMSCLCKLRIRESDQLKTVLELYDMETHQKTSVPNYQKLKTMVKKSVDQKLRLRNFDARHGRIESGAVVKSRKGIIGVDGGKGICYQWEEIRPVFATRPNIVRKNQNTLPPRLLSQPYHDRGREVSAAKVTMCPFFDNRADIICEVPARKRLVNIGIRPRAF